MKFSKTVINFWLDAMLLVAFVALCWVSLILRFVFPPGLYSEGWLLWGGDHEFWATVQFVTLCVFAAGILLHVMLHWSWVCGVIGNWQKRRNPESGAIQRDSGLQTIWGVGLLIAIVNVVGVGIAAAVLTVQSPMGP